MATESVDRTGRAPSRRAPSAGGSSSRAQRVGDVARRRWRERDGAGAAPPDGRVDPDDDATVVARVDARVEAPSGASVVGDVGLTGEAGGDGPLVRWGRASWHLVGVVAAIVVAAVVIGRVRLVLVPVLVAVLISTQLVPIAKALRRRGWPRLAAAWAAFGTLLGGVAAIVLVVAPAVSAEVGNLSTTLGDSGQRIQRWLTDGPFHLSQQSVDDFSRSLGDQISGNREKLLHGVLATAPLVIEIVAAVILTVVLTFFFTKDGDVIVDRLIGMARPARRPAARRFLDETWRILSGYVRGSAVNGIVNASLLSIALAILGVPLIVPIAVLTVVGSFIPILGAVASGGVAAAVALVEHGPTAALVIIGVTIVIHHVEAYVVGPMVMGRSVHLHPVAVIVAISAGTVAFGVLGAFVAVPAVAVIAAAIDRANADAGIPPVTREATVGVGIDVVDDGVPADVDDRALADVERGGVG